MKRVRLAISVFVLALAACDGGGSGGASSAAQSGNPPSEQVLDAVKQRQAVLTLMKKNFGPLVGMVQDKVPYDAVSAQRYAGRLPVLIGMIEESFVFDTRGANVETAALDRIWEQFPEFQQKVSAALDAANNLAAVAGDEAQLGAAAERMGKACGSCHDDFREDDD